MNLDEAKETIKARVKCGDYLRTAPNHKGATGFICEACGSGTHNGNKSTGAVEYYERTNTWYCHKCGAGSDIIDLFKYKNGVTYKEAIEELAKIAGVTIDRYRPLKVDNPAASKKDPDGQETEREPEPVTGQEESEAPDYIDYYIECVDRLEKYPAAVEYLRTRGISLQTARKCLIGFDPAADPATAPGATTGVYKAHPTPRIIAPCDNGFYSNRRIDGQSEFKCIYPKGSSGREHIFNEAAVYTNRSGYCFVVEGFFDALAVEEHGHQAAALNSAGNGNLLIELLENRPAPGLKFIVGFDQDANQDTRAKIQKEAEELTRELRRRGYKAITADICAGYDDPNNAAIIDPNGFEAALYDAAQEASKDELDTFLKDVTSEAYKPVKTGLKFYDDLTGGAIAQTLTILLAAPKSGKTILFQNIAESMAARGQDVIYFNFEMSRNLMLARAISARLYERGNIKRTAKQILQGYKWNDKERQEITAAVEEYRRESLPHIEYNPDGCNPDGNPNNKQLAEFLDLTAEKARKQGKAAPAVFLDYLQLIQGERGEDTKETIRQTIEILTNYARDNNTFVFLISATNREGYNNITMASARDTSNIEFSANTLLTLSNAKDQANTKGRQRMYLKLECDRLDRAGTYSIVFRDGANNVFKGSYNGTAKDPNAGEVPEWLKNRDKEPEPDEEQETLLL